MANKFLDASGVTHLWERIKESFADKTTIENKLNSLTGALTWKGELSALPAVTNYSAGNVIKVGTKEYVLTENNGTKSWDELGDEGSYLLKTTAESTYLKKAAGEVKTANLADGSVTKVKLSTDVQTSLGKADNSLQIGATNTQTTQTVITTESTSTYGDGIKIKNSTDGTEISPKGVTFGGVADAPITMTYEASDTLKVHGIRSGGVDVKIQGVATPIANTDAANKKYVDDKTSGFVKICQTNEPVSGHEQYTTFKVNTANGYGGLQVSDTNGESTSLNGQAVLIGSMNPSGDGANLLTKKGITFGKATQTFGSIQVNSNNKLQITGLDTPTSDTDAANKAYVDNKVSGKVDLDKFAKLSQAVQLFSSATDEQSTIANKEAIANYENTLKSAGVDPTKGYIITWYDPTADYSGLGYYDFAYDQIRGFAHEIDSTLYIFTYNKNTGILSIFTGDDEFATVQKVNSMFLDFGANYVKSQPYGLKTEAVDVVGAINEVNTLATRKATLEEYGVVKANPITSPLHDLSVADTRYGGVKVSIGNDGVLGVGWGSKNYFGVVKIGNGLNVTNGLVSVDSTAVATTSANGLMSSTDKTKLDGVAEGATKVTGININGTVKTATNGIFSLGTVLTSADTGLNASSNNAISNSAVVAALNTKLSKTGLMTINNQAITGGGNINVATEKVTLAYNPDDSYMTGEQYKAIFTDAYESSKIPNVELVYTAEGDYEVLALKRIDRDDTYYHLYFSSSSVEDTTNVWIYGVQVDVLREDDDTSVSHDMTCTELQSTSINSIAKDAAKTVDATEILTASTVTKSLTMADKKNFIIMPTVEAAQIRVPAYPTDGYTITVTGVAAVQNFELKTASSSVPIYNVNSGSTATKYSLNSRGKVVSTYSATLKQWITYKQAIN